MLLGYMILRALRNLVRMMSRLPAGAGRAWARLLNTATTPFVREFMTLADLYRFPTQHFDFHHAQLSFPDQRQEHG